MLAQTISRALLLIGALALLNACVNSPLGADAQVKLYTWDNRVVPFYDTQTIEDEAFDSLRMLKMVQSSRTARES